MVKELQRLELISCGVSTILILLVSLSTLGSSFAQSGMNATQSQNVSNAIAIVLNMTNQTNPTGAVVNQMIQATSANSSSAANMSSAANTTNATS